MKSFNIVILKLLILISISFFSIHANTGGEPIRIENGGWIDASNYEFHAELFAKYIESSCCSIDEARELLDYSWQTIGITLWGGICFLIFGYSIYSIIIGNVLLEFIFIRRYLISNKIDKNIYFYLFYFNPFYMYHQVVLTKEALLLPVLFYIYIVNKKSIFAWLVTIITRLNLALLLMFSFFVMIVRKKSIFWSYFLIIIGYIFNYNEIFNYNIFNADHKSEFIITLINYLYPESSILGLIYSPLRSLIFFTAPIGSLFEQLSFYEITRISNMLISFYCIFIIYSRKLFRLSSLLVPFWISSSFLVEGQRLYLSVTFFLIFSLINNVSKKNG